MLQPPPLPRTLAASLRDLESQKASVRASAIRDLVRHALTDSDARAKAIPLLSAKLKDDSGEVRGAAAVALGDLEAKEALPALLVAMEDDVEYVRQMAINALGEIGDLRAMQRLERALGDDRSDVRYQAVMAFCRVARRAGRDVRDALARGIEDEDHAVRYIALRVAEETVDELKDSRLESLAPKAKPLLEDREVSVRLAAAIFLAKVGDESGRAMVAKVVRGEPIGPSRPEKEDEQEAVELSGRLELRDCIPHLEKRAWGLGRWVRDTCSFHAKIALAAMGHERAKKEIIHDLSSGNRRTREAAVVAAGRARLAEARALLEKLRGEDTDRELVQEALGRLT
jgi:HEAT repeat protein